MGMVLQFPQRAERQSRTYSGTGQILVFTGVRYERDSSENADTNVPVRAPRRVQPRRRS